ncbi:MAG TPA: choice-of-anchor D domain-containing protein, partial [Candidatus Sulfotelmatobacter sp.]
MKRHYLPRTFVGCGFVCLNVFLFAAAAGGQLAVTPSSLNFGSVQVGSTGSETLSMSNTGDGYLMIYQATVTGTGFSISGPRMPLMLRPGQSASLTTAFAPQSNGTYTGTIALEYSRNFGERHSNLVTVALTGTGTGTPSSQLTATPTSLSFGNVQDGSSTSLSETLTNTGGSSLTISAASASGTGYNLSGLTLPVTLTAGQSISFSVVFSPTTGGGASGSVSITSTASNTNLSIPLSGTGMTQGTLTANPTSLAFGNVQDGSSATLSETLTNTGGSSLTISAASASGTGFSLSGLTLPVTLTAGQSTSFSVKFAPTAAGAATGSVTITSNGSNPSLS